MHKLKDRNSNQPCAEMNEFEPLKNQMEMTVTGEGLRSS